MHKMNIVHLTASPCFGGSERQMLELGREMASCCRSVYVSFQEEGRCRDFLTEAESEGFCSFALQNDFPRIVSTIRELHALLCDIGATILCSHGYKANLLGLWVARRMRIPIISVSHGWTGESVAVKLYEALDRATLRYMDMVVCVSEGQARKVRRYGVPRRKVRVIRDAVRADRFTTPKPEYRGRLESLFPDKPEVIVGAAGRLSPEKGYRFLVDAAAEVLRDYPDTGFVLFGDGPLREEIARRVAAKELRGRFRLPGFCSDLDGFLPHFDLFVLPSFTEGLPNVVLEAFAARVPVVATAVGGTPEVVEDGVNGYLAPPGDAGALADRIGRLIANPNGRRAMGTLGRQRIDKEFSFACQAKEYEEVLGRLLSRTNGEQKPSTAAGRGGP